MAKTRSSRPEIQQLYVKATESRLAVEEAVLAVERALSLKFRAEWAQRFDIVEDLEMQLRPLAEKLSMSK